MKIPNYDTKSPSSKGNKNFLDEDFRMLVSAQTRCGKTNVVMHILRKPLVYYDKIYFYTPNQHQDKIVDLKELMVPFHKKLVIPFLNYTPQMRLRIQQNIQEIIEKWLFLMILLMLLTAFNEKLQIIGQMEGIMEFLQFIFPNLIMMFPKKSD